MIASPYFPNSFDPQATCILLAGCGDYPQWVWKGMQKMGVSARVFSFTSEYPPWLSSLPETQRFFFEIGQVGTWLKALQQQQAQYVLLAGQIQPKKLFHGLHPDVKALWLLSRLKEKNATTIFGALLAEIEKLGIEILDARCFMEDHLVHKGILTRKSYQHIDPQQLQRSIEVCRGIAALDVGQSIVVRNGTTLLAEGFDGTDAMIQHAGTICSQEMGLIKLAKPTQDFRFDVPIFGLKTLQNMHTAGIQWAALESNRTLILDPKTVLAEADRQKITLLGF